MTPQEFRDGYQQLLIDKRAIDAEIRNLKAARLEEINVHKVGDIVDIQYSEYIYGQYVNNVWADGRYKLIFEKASVRTIKLNPSGKSAAYSFFKLDSNGNLTSSIIGVWDVKLVKT